MATKREGRWDCTTCGTAGNLGRGKVCPHCGAPRPFGVKFYLPEGSPPVSEPDQLRDASAGPDWNCENCNATNAGYRVTCSQCGAPKPTAAKTQQVTDYALGEAPTSGDRGPQPEPEWICANCGSHNSESRTVCQNCSVRRGEKGSEKYNREAQGAPSPRPSRAIVEEALQWLSSTLPVKPSKNWFYYGALAAGMLLVLFGIWFLFIRTIETPLTVTGFHWERTVSIQIYKPIIEEDWSIPAGGRYKSERTEIHHYESVFDHNETRYRTKCKTVSDGTEQESYQDCNNVQTGSSTYVCGSRDLGNGYFEDIECARPEYDRVCTTKYRTVPKTKQECREVSYQEAVNRQEPRYATLYTVTTHTY